MPPLDIIKTQYRMSVMRSEMMAQEINTIVLRYMSWISQLVLALARKAKGPGSSPGPG